MTLLGADPSLTPAAKSLKKALSEREQAWVREQKILKIENTQHKKQTACNTSLQQDKALKHCKTWGGPSTSTDELEQALQRAENEQFCVKQELLYYRLAHPLEMKLNKQLFKVRGVSHEEM